ncbi:MAG TPA: VWA domain-containing protein [Vicinamibacterales bacterium]|nr:VWA domain-containing protein [Vicinamibacterales bacterium]
MRARPRPLVRLAAMAALAVAAIAAGPQTPPPPVQTPQQPVFRTGVETVAIYATVLDQYDELVKNLTAADVEILDDGKPQEVTVFEAGLQPITAILMIDTSESMALNVELARYAAEQFVIRMLPGDKVRVGSFSDAITISPEFTSDRDLLINDIRDRLHIGNPTRLWDAVDQTMTDLAPLGGRRILVLFTDGDDTYSKRAAVTVLDRARSDELMVYTVQFRTTPFARRQEIASMKMPTLKEAFLYDPGRNPPPSEGLRRISSQTGGGNFVLGQNDNVGATFTRIAEELHFQYVMGFSPQKLDGKIHELEVKPKKKNLTVRARKSYYAAPKAQGAGGR